MPRDYPRSYLMHPESLFQTSIQISNKSICQGREKIQTLVESFNTHIWQVTSIYPVYWDENLYKIIK